MSNKSGTSQQVISTPSGGGALQGIGEMFSPDLFTGTGNFSIPIALPPGRNGFQPELNLVYSTGNGNGPFGLGWALSIPGIMRKTSQGIPRYDDEKDTFVLSGAEDLVVVEQLEGVTKYRPRTEGLFARIEHHRSASQNYWKVWSKDGLVSYYGTPRPENAADIWQDPATVADPANPRKVFAWKLSRTEDPFGNQIIYTYLRDRQETQNRHWDYLYLKTIQYVDYGDRDNPQFLVSVNFDYGETEDLKRPDSFSEYRAGFEMRTELRCREVVVETHADTTQKVRSYQFVYLDDRQNLIAEALQKQLPSNGTSLLSQVKVIGHDGDKAEELPALEFQYSGFQPLGRTFLPLDSRHLPTRSLGNPELDLADLFGNGLPDILEMNGSVRYWRNRGGGVFDPPRPMREAPAGVALADPGVQMLDANGDGRIDLLVTTRTQAGYYSTSPEGTWDKRSFQAYNRAPSFNLDDPEVQLVDLTGDGVTDVIRSGSRLECFFNDPTEGWAKTRWVPRRDVKEFPNVNFSEPRVKWGDMTGDGMQDIVLVHDGNIEYWPNLGYGNWGKRISMRNAPRYRYGYDPRRVLIGDVDGDGVADLVYVDDRRVILWINQNGNGWSDPIEINGTPAVTDLDAVRLVDLMGTGVSGILWSRDASPQSRTSGYFLDFTGGVKPYLLTEMDNHMGAVTRVQYRPSTEFYRADWEQGRPWKTTLPFPVQVVARVEVIDRLSKGKLTTEYKYHHGYWDGGEREFRGFGFVEQCDTETFEDYNQNGLHGTEGFLSVSVEHFSPPTLTKSWFHLGPVGSEFGDWQEVDFSDEYWQEDAVLLERPPEIIDFLKQLPRWARRDALRTLRGQVLRTELYALDRSDREERPYTVTESVSGVREVVPTALAIAKQRIFFPFGLAQRTTQWERGNDPMTQFSFSEDYDEYGMPRSQISIAVPRGREFLQRATEAEPYLATMAKTDYIHRSDEFVYIVDRVARATSYEVVNDGLSTVWELKADVLSGAARRDIIGQSLTFYDGVAYEGLPYGQIGQFGMPVRTESLVFTPEILEEAYKSGDSVLADPEEPPYLSADGVTTWSNEYPQSFQNRIDALPDRAGYLYRVGEAGSPYAKGYFVISDRQQYDFQVNGLGIGRGLGLGMLDPLGREMTVVYDRFELMPERVTDALGLSTQARYDYRVMQPFEVVDANNNRQQFAFTPLGLAAWVAVMGKAGQQVGDTPDQPGSWFEYDFLAFEERGEPVSVHTIQRQDHRWDVVKEENRQRSLSGQPPLTASEIDGLFPFDEVERFPERFIQSREFSDGFGRLLQTRAQAEEVLFGDGEFGNGTVIADQQDEAGTKAVVVGRRQSETDPNVTVSGWQVYDNKGQVIQQYEPFYSTGWVYRPPLDRQYGQKVEMFYDPRGQVVRTVNPDGSQQWVIYGVPVDVKQPEVFTPTPWEAYTYDANDLAPLSSKVQADGSVVSLADRAPVEHHFTPVSIEVDALGRTIRAIERNGHDPATDWYLTRSSYDIRGNLLTVTDVLGRLSFRYAYDLADRPLRNWNIDAGLRRMVMDAAGNEIERRDSKGALILQAFDDGNRPLAMWARDGDGQPMTMRLGYGYGDRSNLSEAEQLEKNLRGQLYTHWDEAGKQMFEPYDFKENLLKTQRQVLSDAQILTGLPVDWQQTPELEETVYETTTVFDGLNRVKAVLYPEDVDKQRKLLRQQYNRAGALERVMLDEQVYVERIAYNAKGQRSLIAYGNGVMTRHAYNPETFRLQRLRTEKFEKQGGAGYQPKGIALQDMSYDYDLVGNIAVIKDRAPRCGVADSVQGVDALDRKFAYDPLYRLLSATGRESKGIGEPRPWTDDPREGFNQGSHGVPSLNNSPNQTQLYRERYVYDPAGNMLTWQHASLKSNGWQVSWTRNFGMDGQNPVDWDTEWQKFLNKNWPNPKGNKLTHVKDKKASFGDTLKASQTHWFDVNGNLIKENESRFFDWNYTDQLRRFKIQSGNNNPSIYSYYLYNVRGERVKKLVKKGHGFESIIYTDGGFIHYTKPSKRQQYNNLSVKDNNQLIAFVRIGSPFDTNVQDPDIQLHHSDHISSSTLVIDGIGNWVNREEYFPYGETSFGGYKKKRFRFSGKECDEESKLNYYGYRYYLSWLGRWASCDPAGPIDSSNLYLFSRSNPLRFIDQKGLQADETGSSSKAQKMLDKAEGIEAKADNIQRRAENLAGEIRSEREQLIRKNLRAQKELDNLKPKKNKLTKEYNNLYDKLYERYRSEGRLYLLERDVNDPSRKLFQLRQSLDKVNNRIDSIEKKISARLKRIQQINGRLGESRFAQGRDLSQQKDKLIKKSELLREEASSLRRTAASLTKPVGKMFFHALPLIPAAYTILSTEYPFRERLGSAIAGEIAVGPFDLGMITYDRDSSTQLLEDANDSFEKSLYDLVYDKMNFPTESEMKQWIIFRF